MKMEETKMAIGDKDHCVGCAMGAHPHDTYTTKAPEVRSGEHKAGDDAGCPRVGCRCTWRKPRETDRVPKIRARIAEAIRAHQLLDGRCEACGQQAVYQSLHQADVLMGLSGLSISLR